MISYNKTLSAQEQEMLRLQFEPYMPFEGPIRMREPMNIFSCVLRYEYGTDRILDIYLGIKIADGQRDTNARFDLKKRHYIGPTSTCAELASLMSNQVLSRKGVLLWDCFVGTGSLLVAATAHGAVCVGSDIDMRVLKGLKKGKQVGSIRQNFLQYHLPSPDLLRMDLSVMALRRRPLFASVVAFTVGLTAFCATLRTASARERERQNRECFWRVWRVGAMGRRSTRTARTRWCTTRTT